MTALPGLNVQGYDAAQSQSLHALRDAANKVEASFLAEMLKAGGFGKTPDAFGGGAGEDQFASFLINAQAEQMVEAGGIGLAEHIFNALKESVDGDS